MNLSPTDIINKDIIESDINLVLPLDYIYHKSL